MRLTGLQKGAILAIWTGSLFAAGPGLVLTVPLSIGLLFDCGFMSMECAVIPAVALFPVAIALPIVIASWLLVGVPLTWLLAKVGYDNSDTVGLVGAIAGALVVLAFLWLQDSLGYFAAAILGAVGGGVTGKIWGETREAVGASQQSEI